MPRFGAVAPAILGHRSPRAERRCAPAWQRDCGVPIRLYLHARLFEPPPHRAERYRIAIR
ncbi:hypothetical protein T261_07010 [Streptomyces lydicus]|nr:hypothetical protein T261_07010 [Streptomyces lydicus]